MDGKFIDFITGKIPGIIGIFIFTLIAIVVGISLNLKRLHKPLDEWE